MFAKTLVKLAAGGRRRLSSFAHFLKARGNDPRLNGLKATQRGQQLGKWWRALKPAERAAFERKSKNTMVTLKRRAPKKPRKAGPFAKFVKLNYKKVKHLPFKQRLAAIAKLWANKKH